MSDFYNDQLNALVRFENPTVFTVNFSVECVKAYLDALHGIRTEKAAMTTTLELIKFLKDLARGESGKLLNFLAKFKTNPNSRANYWLFCASSWRVRISTFKPNYWSQQYQTHLTILLVILSRLLIVVIQPSTLEPYQNDFTRYFSKISITSKFWKK